MAHMRNLPRRPRTPLVVAGHADGEPAELTDEVMAAVARLMRRG
jgi:hypothetical protein